MSSAKCWPFCLSLNVLTFSVWEAPCHPSARWQLLGKWSQWIADICHGSHKCQRDPTHGEAYLIWASPITTCQFPRTLQWCHMSAMASQIIHCLFTHLFRLTWNRTLKPMLLTFCEGNSGFPHKGPVKQRNFCVMTPSWNTNSRDPTAHHEDKIRCGICEFAYLCCTFPLLCYAICSNSRKQLFAIVDLL